MRQERGRGAHASRPMSNMSVCESDGDADVLNDGERGLSLMKIC
jgi:hypothetical protein